ncbi:hypothetical protein RD110_18735 [Rhodoferax koreense]|uniref:Uncharacterized protein n=1 Tax=Rhodoferax koreensis TaxID=1842727 RepID=A0A1P8JZ65_9BURK|nr:hypothetical protein [Rhodoferax koreense]APW38991.1 hypothetical protein RD110_18735 [Rhodoferax koreense]
MNCPHCNGRGWVPASQPDRLVNLCACRMPKRAWRPPGWAWGLAAFIGLVIANAIVPTVHAAVSATATESDPDWLVWVCCALVAFGAVVAAMMAAAYCAPLDPFEPTPLQQRLLADLEHGNSIPQPDPDRRDGK